MQRGPARWGRWRSATAAIVRTAARGATAAEAPEAETGILVPDSIGLVLRGAIRVAGANPSRIRNRGKPFGV